MRWQNNGGWYYAKLLHLCPSTHLYKDPSFTTMHFIAAVLHQQKTLC